MSSTESANTKPTPESAITPQAAAKQVENVYDTGDTGTMDQTRALLTSQFTDYLKDVQNGPSSALAEWKQIGADDATNRDDVLPMLALDWGFAYTSHHELLSQPILQGIVANPALGSEAGSSTGDSTADLMLTKLSAQYLLDNYSTYAGLDYGAPMGDNSDQAASIPILSQDIAQAQNAIGQQPGWNTTQEVDPPQSEFWTILGYVLG